jgi:hypothetical protein
LFSHEAKLRYARGIKLVLVSGLDGWQLYPDNLSRYDHMAEDLKFQLRLEIAHVLFPTKAVSKGRLKVVVEQEGRRERR